MKSQYSQKIEEIKKEKAILTALYNDIRKASDATNNAEHLKLIESFSDKLNRPMQKLIEKEIAINKLIIRI